MRSDIGKGLGTAKFVNNKTGFNPTEAKRFLNLAIENGYQFLDTAPRYSSCDAERMLGSTGPILQQFSVCSKFGKRYSKLPHPFNRIHQRLLARQSEIDVWRETFTPNRLRPELIGSLRRLGLDRIDTYLLHAVPANLNLDNYAEILQGLKREGLVNRIGVSIDIPCNSDLSWCDVIQTPLRGFGWANWMEHQTAVINSVYLDSDGKIGASLASLPFIPERKIALIGTTSAKHLAEFAQEIDSI